MVNTYCHLNTDPEEDVHVNAQRGTWPVTKLFNGKPKITNQRYCMCGKQEPADGLAVIYQD